VGMDSMGVAGSPLSPAAAVLALTMGLVATQAFGEAKPDSVEMSVVKVFSTVLYPDLYRPWTKKPPSEITGSGVVIDGKRILSNAHVVLYASQVQVQANQAGDKLSAKVVAVAPGIDLAVLKLDDERFFESHRPLPLAKGLPEIKDAVLAYGYPTGGEALSITKGIISRIEFAQYALFEDGLRIQIDAAINPGNSGGPAVVGEKMIGLAFSHLGKAENIGYIIPSEEIELFLQDIADGHYDGKPAIHDDVELQTFENDALRSFLKLDRAVQGVVVHAVERVSPAPPLKEWDVITKIGPTPIDDQGMIQTGSGLRLSFRYLIQQLAHAGKVPLTIVRAGKELQIELPVTSNRPELIPDLKGAYPSYFIWGPLVFSSATRQFVGGFVGTGANMMGMMGFLSAPLAKRLFDRPTFDGEALVVISSPFFPQKLAAGYGNPLSKVIKSVNGVPIKNLLHLVEVLRDSRDDFIVIECEGHGEALVFTRKEMQAATDGILTENGVRSQGSPDVLTVWNARAPRH
jgi:S1-C subfamily serine protease